MSEVTHQPSPLSSQPFNDIECHVVFPRFRQWSINCIGDTNTCRNCNGVGSSPAEPFDVDKQQGENNCDGHAHEGP